jgi:hypothetical protein
MYCRLEFPEIFEFGKSNFLFQTSVELKWVLLMIHTVALHHLVLFTVVLLPFNLPFLFCSAVYSSPDVCNMIN